MPKASNNFSTFHSGHVVITACIAMTWSISVFVIRLYLRAGTKRPFGLDDYACTLGMVLSMTRTKL